MGKFKKTETTIDGVYIIEPTVFGDNRGYFMETYSKKDFEEIGLNYDFVQDNQSKSKKGVLRGLHFQKENTQAKLVRCIKGEVFDVAVDLRPGSKTYGKWEGVILTEENKKMFMIPKGFAHGFLVLSEEAETDAFLFLITRAVTSRPNIIVVIKNIIVVAIKGLNDFLGFIIYLLCNSLSVKEILIINGILALNKCQLKMI